MQPFRLEHYGTTLTTTDPTKISLHRGSGHGIRLRNMEAAGGNAMEISFNGGKGWYRVLAGQEFWFDAIIFHFFYVRAVVANVTWCAVVQEG